MMTHPLIFDCSLYEEIRHLDEGLRALQDLTLNEDWGYWHFSQLKAPRGHDITQWLKQVLAEIPSTGIPIFRFLTVNGHT